jgi:DNA-binding transcriptional LysR family regulator
MDILAAFIATADRKSTSLAARDLGLTPSAVHKRIDKANELLGVSLFSTTNGGLLLTEAGRGFYRDATRVIQHGLLAEDKVAAHLRLENLVVGRSAYLSPRLLSKLLRISLESEWKDRIQQIPGLTPHLAQSVAEGTIDVGFGELPIARPELISRTLWEEPILVCVHERHVLATKATIRPDDLRDEPIVAVGRALWPQWHQEIDQFFRDFDVQLDVIADAFGPHEALAMVAQKIGICILAASDVSNATVTGKILSPKVLSRRYGFFMREDNHHAAAKAFVDHVLERVNNIAS